MPHTSPPPAPEEHPLFFNKQARACVFSYLEQAHPTLMLHYLERAREELTPESSRMAERRAEMKREDVRSEKRKREVIEKEWMERVTWEREWKRARREEGMWKGVIGAEKMDDGKAARRKECTLLRLLRGGWPWGKESAAAEEESEKLLA